MAELDGNDGDVPNILRAIARSELLHTGVFDLSLSMADISDILPPIFQMDISLWWLDSHDSPIPDLWKQYNDGMEALLSEVGDLSHVFRV